MEKIEKSYHKLIVWQKMRELLLTTYQLTEKLPLISYTNTDQKLVAFDTFGTSDTLDTLY